MESLDKAQALCDSLREYTDRTIACIVRMLMLWLAGSIFDSSNTNTVTKAKSFRLHHAVRYHGLDCIVSGRRWLGGNDSWLNVYIWDCWYTGGFVMTSYVSTHYNDKNNSMGDIFVQKRFVLPHFVVYIPTLWKTTLTFCMMLYNSKSHFQTNYQFFQRLFTKWWSYN